MRRECKELFIKQVIFQDAFIAILYIRLGNYSKYIFLVNEKMKYRANKKKSGVQNGFTG